MNGVFGKPAHDLGTCSSQTSTLGLVFAQSKHDRRESSLITDWNEDTVHAITDVIWTTIHLTEKTDLVEIENEIIAPDYETLDARLSYDKPKELT